MRIQLVRGEEVEFGKLVFGDGLGHSLEMSVGSKKDRSWAEREMLEKGMAHHLGNALVAAVAAGHGLV